MAVLEHIHPDSASVFDHIARCAKGVLAIEPAAERGHRTQRQHPWDIPGEFTQRGLVEVSRVALTAIRPLAPDEADADLANYVAYRFSQTR